MFDFKIGTSVTIGRLIIVMAVKIVCFLILFMINMSLEETTWKKGRAIKGTCIQAYCEKDKHCNKVIWISDNSIMAGCIPYDYPTPLKFNHPSRCCKFRKPEANNKPNDGKKPDEPNKKPDKPNKKPDKPNKKPDEPKKKPDEPKNKPDEPNKKPDEPNKQPDKPNEKPDEPNKKTEESNKKPDEPNKKPDDTNKIPDKPNQKTDDPNNKPEEANKEPADPKKDAEDPKKDAEDPKKDPEDPNKKKDDENDNKPSDTRRMLGRSRTVKNRCMHNINSLSAKLMLILNKKRNVDVDNDENGQKYFLNSQNSADSVEYQTLSSVENTKGAQLNPLLLLLNSPQNDYDEGLEYETRLLNDNDKIIKSFVKSHSNENIEYKPLFFTTQHSDKKFEPLLSLLNSQDNPSGEFEDHEKSDQYEPLLQFLNTYSDENFEYKPQLFLNSQNTNKHINDQNSRDSSKSDKYSFKSKKDSQHRNRDVKEKYQLMYTQNSQDGGDFRKRKRYGNIRHRFAIGKQGW